jgi:hypothetical protein
VTQEKQGSGSGGDVFDTEALQALPVQIMLLVEGARSCVRKALEEESLEKVRDLLIEIKECLNVMNEAANAAFLNEKDSDNA